MSNLPIRFQEHLQVSYFLRYIGTDTYRQCIGHSYYTLVNGRSCQYDFIHKKNVHALHVDYSLQFMLSSVYDKCENNIKELRPSN